MTTVVHGLGSEGGKMTQAINIERVRRVSFTERVKAVLDADPMVLCNSFYVLFGFLISGSLVAAAFFAFATHRDYLEMLFWCAPASTAVWGIAYAGWTDKLQWAWNSLTAFTTLGMIGGIFVVLAIPGQTNHDLMIELVICACALPALWTLIMGLRHITF